MALLLCVFALGATAVAQDTMRIRGTIVALDGNTLTIATPAATLKVGLADNARISYLLKSDLSKIVTNTYVGTVAVPQPDGSLRAVEVQIFPEAARGAGEGSQPWDSLPNSTMTNATVDTIAATTVDKVDGRMLTLTYKGEQKRVFVPASAPIVTFAPADRSALVPGAHVVIFSARKASDGSLLTAGIVVGKDGLVPPM